MSGSVTGWGELHAIAATSAVDLLFDTVNYPLVDDVVADRFEVEDRAMAIPDGPGLGIEVNEWKIERHRVDT